MSSMPFLARIVTRVTMFVSNERASTSPKRVNLPWNTERVSYGIFQKFCSHLSPQTKCDSFCTIAVARVLEYHDFDGILVHAIR